MYDKKMQELDDALQRLEQTAQQYQGMGKSYQSTINTIVSLASRTSEIIESSEPHEKQRFLKFLLQNPKMHDRDLVFELRKPMNYVLELANIQNETISISTDGPIWLGVRVSNSPLSNDSRGISGGQNGTRVSSKMRQMRHGRGAVSHETLGSNNMQNYQQIGRFSDEQLVAFKEIFSKRLGREATDEETFESANALMNFADTFYGVAVRLHQRQRPLRNGQPHHRHAIQ
ncbi:hypothetical protein EBT31_17470 [bacterium]|nr:hypothetical protein [bacterium]